MLRVGNDGPLAGIIGLSLSTDGLTTATLLLQHLSLVISQKSLAKQKDYQNFKNFYGMFNTYSISISMDSIKCFSIYQQGNWFIEIFFQDKRKIFKKKRKVLLSVTTELAHKQLSYNST